MSTYYILALLGVHESFKNQTKQELQLLIDITYILHTLLTVDDVIGKPLGKTPSSLQLLKVFPSHLSPGKRPLISCGKPLVVFLRGLFLNSALMFSLV